MGYSKESSLLISCCDFDTNGRSDLSIHNLTSAIVTSGERLKLLSVVIPVRDEEGCIASTIEHLHLELELRGVPHEIVVVDDGSTDRTWTILQEEQKKVPQLKPIRNPGPHGFGRAITRGLDAMTGDAVVIMMADESDDCRDVVRYWEKLNEGFDCVFGSRFVKGRGTIDYPRVKLFMNRLANAFVRILFNHGLNDTTNAFKAYRKTAGSPLKSVLKNFFLAPWLGRSLPRCFLSGSILPCRLCGGYWESGF